MEKLSVLFVDDESSILEQAKIFLEKEEDQLDIETGVSAEDGLELFEKGEYDAIVADYQMPGMNGLDFLKEIRGEKSSDIPFIIFTGKGREEVAMEALNLGADRYLQKGSSPKSQYGVLAQAIVQEVEHAKAQEEIKSLAKYPSENPNPVLRVTENGKILYCNDAGLSLLSKWGVEVGEKVPRSWLNLVKEAFKSGEVMKEEIEVEGTIYSFMVTPVPDEGYINLYGSDVTDRVEAEERFRVLFEEVPLPYQSLDEDGNVLLVNQAWAEKFGYSEEEIKNMNISEIIHPDSMSKFESVFPKFKEKGEVHGVKYKMQKKDGDTVTVTFDGKIEYNNGKFERTHCILRDITEGEESEGKD